MIDAPDNVNHFNITITFCQDNLNLIIQRTERYIYRIHAIFITDMICRTKKLPKLPLSRATSFTDKTHSQRLCCELNTDRTINNSCRTKSSFSTGVRRFSSNDSFN